MNTENNTENKPKTILFLDSVGRLILGEKLESDGDSFDVKNPVVVMINADQTGKMSVQLFPLLFREFLADKDTDVVLHYNKNNVTLTNIDTLDFRLQTQYAQMFNKNNVYVAPQSQPQGGQGGGQGVINLFDE
jgi:hypothetical protein